MLFKNLNVFMLTYIFNFASESNKKWGESKEIERSQRNQKKPIETDRNRRKKNKKWSKAFQQYNLNYSRVV